MTGGMTRMPGNWTAPRHLPGFAPHERTVRVPYAGDALTVTYRCDHELLMKLSRRVTSGRLTDKQKHKAACRLLERAIVAWDLPVSDEDRAPYPATAEALARLDPDFLGAVLAALIADYEAALAGYRAGLVEYTKTHIAYRAARGR